RCRKPFLVFTLRAAYSTGRRAGRQDPSTDASRGVLLFDAVFEKARHRGGGHHAPVDVLRDRGVLEDIAVVEFDLQRTRCCVVPNRADSARTHLFALHDPSCLCNSAPGAVLFLLIGFRLAFSRTAGTVLGLIAEDEASEQHAPLHAGIAVHAVHPLALSPDFMWTAPTAAHRCLACLCNSGRSREHYLLPARCCKCAAVSD